MEPRTGSTQAAHRRHALIPATRCWKSWGGQVERWPFDQNHDGGSAVGRRHAAMLEAGADVCFGFASFEGPTSLTTMARVAGVATYQWAP